MGSDSPIHVLLVAAGDTAEAVRHLTESDRIDVITAESFREAIEQFDQTTDVECVVCSHEQSTLDGIALLEVVRSRAPDLPFVLFASGHPAARALPAGATEIIAGELDDKTGEQLRVLVEQAVDYYRAHGDRPVSEARAAIHLDAARDAIAIVQDGQYVFANSRLLDLYGVERREHLIATEFPGSPTFAGIDLTADRLAGCAEGEQLPVMDAVLHSDAGVFPVEVSVQPTEWFHAPAAAVIVRDVSNMRRIEERLRNHMQAVESSSDLLAALDRNRRFLFANEAYCEYHGIDPGNVQGRLLDEVIDDDTISRIENYVQSALDGESVQYEMSRNHSGLGERLLDVRYYPLRGVDGTVRGYGSTIRDITERSERISQIRKIDQILRHNARNSLNVITGHAELIRREGSQLAGQHSAQIIATSDELLETFDKERRITGLLADTTNRERVDVPTVLQRVIDDVRDSYPDARISFSAPPSADAKASGHFPEAVRELVANAVEHAEPAYPVVSVRVTDDDDSVAVSIGDEGPGFPEIELDVLTGEGDMGPLKHGRGLGLWFVSLVVRRSGGRIAVADNDPEGSVVTIDLVK